MSNEKEKFEFDFVATQIHTGIVEILAYTKDEAATKARKLLDECNGGEYAENIKWMIDDSQYSCEQLEERKEEINDEELITPTESYILDALLKKIANQNDMANMKIENLAQELLNAINEL